MLRAFPPPFLQKICHNLPKRKAVRKLSLTTHLCMQLTSMEQSIPCKNCLSGAVFHQEAYAILCMARGIERLDSYISNLKSLPILGRFCDALAVFASDDWSAFEFWVG